MDRNIYVKETSPCNCTSVRRASQSITKVYNEFLAPSNLKVNQLILLKNIKILEPISVSYLALIIRLDRTTLVRNLKPLEESGLVEDISREKTRSRQLKLTAKGTETYKYSEEL